MAIGGEKMNWFSRKNCLHSSSWIIYHPTQARARAAIFVAISIDLT
jgi:hypothetical protein